LARKRHVIDEFVPEQRVILAKHVVSVVRRAVTIASRPDSHDRIV
jgi:hypothetical protein